MKNKEIKMKRKTSCIEIVFTIQIQLEKIQEFTIDRITLEKLLNFNKKRITQKEYDFLVILNDKADEYFYKNIPYSNEKNLFYGLPKNIEKHFKLPEKYKVLCIKEKIEQDFEQILFRGEK